MLKENQPGFPCKSEFEQQPKRAEGVITFPLFLHGILPEMTSDSSRGEVPALPFVIPVRCHVSAVVQKGRCHFRLEAACLCIQEASGGTKFLG